MQDPLKGKQNQDNLDGGLSARDDSKLLTSRGSRVVIPRTAWKLLIILSSIATMVMYAETMLIPAIPDLISDFNVSYGTSSWILTTYLISGAVATPIAGKLSDVYGKKKVLLAVMLIYAIGVSFAGFASNIYTLLLVRAIQGIGMGMFPIAFGLIRDQFPREKISIGQGIISSMFASRRSSRAVRRCPNCREFWMASYFFHDYSNRYYTFSYYLEVCARSGES